MENNNTPEQVNLDTISNIILPQQRRVHSWTRLAAHYIAYLLAFCALVAITIAGVDWLGGISAFTNLHILAITLLSYGYEPLKVITTMTIGERFPETEEISAEGDEELALTTQQAHIATHKDLAIIIPCHMSADIILDTIASCLQHVEQQQIYIMDNGSTQTPGDNTCELVNQHYPNVNTYYLPKIANKTLAVYYGTQFAKSNYRYCLVIDDDVHLPTNFAINRRFIDEDENVQGIVYPISAATNLKPTTVSSLITEWQNIEYGLTASNMLFLDKVEHSVIRPHGAVSLWMIHSLVSVLKKHNTVFQGEDAMLGLILQHMHTASGQQSILRIDPSITFKTFVPQTYFGPKNQGNLWYQRVRSWKAAQFNNFWNLALKPFVTIWNWRERGLLSIAVIKEHQFYNLHTQIMYVARFPLMLLAFNNPLYWFVIGASYGAQLMTTLLFNYVKLPSSQRNSISSVLTYPIYKTIDSIMGTAAFLRSIFIDRPTSIFHPSIEELIKSNQLPLADEIDKSAHCDKEPLLEAKHSDTVELFDLSYSARGESKHFAYVLSRPGALSAGGYAPTELEEIGKSGILIIPEGHSESDEPIAPSKFSLQHCFFAKNVKQACDKLEATKSDVVKLTS